MKTKHLLSGLLLLGAAITMVAQTNIATSTLTSRGWNAGTSGNSNTFYGADAGKVTSGAANTFIGSQAGNSNTLGGGNVFLGASSGANTTSCYNNLYLGQGAGKNMNGYDNTIVGSTAGINSNGLITANTNTYIGTGAGINATGSNNIFIGPYTGYTSTESNLLHIDDNSNFDNLPPLIWGNFANDQLKFNGKVGIGLGTTAFPTTAGSVNVTNYSLIVHGGVLAKEVRVATTWADYVFENDYCLKPLEEVECYIAENGHLPNVPSAAEVERDGIELGDMARLQQEKIEELTLYAIQQQKQLDKQEAEIKELKALLHSLGAKK